MGGPIDWAAQFLFNYWCALTCYLANFHTFNGLWCKCASCKEEVERADKKTYATRLCISGINFLIFSLIRGKKTGRKGHMKNVAIYSEPSDAHRRLAQLGLTEDILIQAVLRGQAEGRSRTENHPQMYRGLTPWGEANCALREGLSTEGWIRCDEGNLPFTVNKDRTLAIIVATGDQNTGNKTLHPCTQSAKGPQTVKAVAENQRSLFPIKIDSDDVEKMREAHGRQTWMLLFHRDAGNRQVRCELSRPIDMDEDGHVAGWAERIVLNPTPFDSDAVRIPTDAPQTPNIDVNVKLRNA